MPRLGILGLSALLYNAVSGSSMLDNDASVDAQHVLASPSNTADLPPGHGPLHGRFLHITDFHPDAFYKVQSSTDEDHACHRGKGGAGYYGAETSDCDTPFSLVNATFDWLDKHWKDKIDFIIWTGDSARHDSDEKIPRNAKQVLGTNRWIAEKFTDLLYNETTRALSLPVVPTFGNNDILPHNIMLPGPNRWLQDYAGIWQHFIPEEQRHSFGLGGYFYVEVIPNKLAVFSLNTLYFFDRNAAIDDCINPVEPGYKQLEWLRVQLSFMRQRNMKAIIIGHVPPARTPSKMLWDESCWQKYTLWMQQYRDVVAAGIFGHMNIDHFMLQDSEDVDMHKLDVGEVFKDGIRDNLDDELTVMGATDYLVEMRDTWSKLPKGVARIPSQSSGTNKNKEKLGGPWGERFSATMVGGSIVPNFLPSFRIYEYNTTGLENVAVWKGPTIDRTAQAPKIIDITDRQSLKEILIEIEKNKKKKKKDKNRKGKKGRKPKPKDPNLVVPEPPATTSPPGPAYSPQPLTLLGYEQWLANLTTINNDTGKEDSVEEEKWRHGNHGDKNPPANPQPREFMYELEYNTSTDNMIKLADLTVPSFLKLAYRMGKKPQSGKTVGLEDDEISVSFEEDDDEVGWHDDETLEQAGNETVTDVTPAKKRKHKKHKKHNKVWLRFLKHAFISTVERKQLERLDY